MNRPAVVLQARLGSSRLPGKVLARIGPRTILAHCLLRLSVSGLPLIVATTDHPEDDAIEREARRFGAAVFRGAEHDVLARFIAVAEAFHLTDIVRATADNPFVDPNGPQRVLRLQQRVAADHVAEHGLPVGAAVEAVSREALERASSWIDDAYDREHVTSFIKRDSRFRAYSAVAPGDVRRPGLRLTVDSQEDLDFMRSVFGRLGEDDVVPSLATVIRAAEASRPGQHLGGSIQQEA